jgi:hypothetical protein
MDVAGNIGSRECAMCESQGEPSPKGIGCVDSGGNVPFGQTSCPLQLYNVAENHEL